MIFDTLIIGGGQGAALARMLGEAGQNVALCEKRQLGGTCINDGCTPYKSFLASATRFYDAKTAGELGVSAEPKFDWGKAMGRAHENIRKFRGDVEGVFEPLPNVQIFRGHARLCEPNRVQVNGQTLESKHVVLAVGARAAIPEIEGLESVSFLDYHSFLKLEDAPRKLLICGGGYIAVEVAHALARLGIAVELVQNEAQILLQEDAHIAAQITDFLREDGVTIHLEKTAKAVEKRGDELILTLDDNQELRGSHLLVATGQKPNTDDLGVERAGVKLSEKGEIECDEWLEAAPNVFALGDCKGGPAFVHTAFDDARILADRILHRQKRSIKNRLNAYVVFTQPQLGRVGLSQCQAREKGLEFTVRALPVSDTARGIESGFSRGVLEVLVENETDKILGAALLCQEGGELLAALQTAMLGQVPAHVLRDAPFSHPTQSESFNRLFG